MTLKNKLHLKYFLFITLMLTWIIFTFSILCIIVHLALKNSSQSHQQLQLPTPIEDIYSDGYYDTWEVGESE